MEEKIKCTKCGVMVSKFAIKRHEQSCDGNSNKFKGGKTYSIFVSEEWKTSENKYKCPFCSKEYSKKGIGTHIWRNHGEGKDFNPNRDNEKESRKIWNKGLTSETDERVKRLSKKISKSLKGKGHPHTDETKKKLSEEAKRRGLGGVRQSKRILYKGVILGSSYELELAKSLDENDIKWTTCGRFKYKDINGKNRTYTPDLYLLDYDIYLDPKNDFLINNINPRLGFKDSEKIKWVMEQNEINVIILDKNELSWGALKNKLPL